MTTATKGHIVRPYHVLYLGKPSPALTDDLLEVATVYPGYKVLFYRSAAGSSWKQIKAYAEKHGLQLHAISTQVDISLTCVEFEAEWLHPSQAQLRRDPLTERKLAGWYDDEGYAFTHDSSDDHTPPTHKLSRTERAERASKDIDLIKTHQAERQAERLQALEGMAVKRRRGRKRRA